MMIKKPTWFILVLFLVLLIITLIIQKTGTSDEPEMTPTPQPAGKVFPGEVFPTVKSLSFKDSDGNFLILNKVNGVWSISTGAGEVNQASVAELLANLESLEIMARPDSSINTSNLGITPLSDVITVTGSEAIETSIRIGMLTPTGSGYYLQVNNLEPVIASKGGVETLLNIFNREYLLVPSSNPP